MTATPWDVEPRVQPAAKPIAPHDACERCKGTGGIEIGPGLYPGTVEKDECPTCFGTGLNTQARRDYDDLAEERYQEWWA